jgi:hypothetical protein
MVWSVIICARVRHETPFRIKRSANGTKVMRATSLVIAIAAKKVVMTKIAARLRAFPANRRIDDARISNAPEARRPATTDIRQKRHESTFQSI